MHKQCVPGPSFFFPVRSAPRLPARKKRGTGEEAMGIPVHLRCDASYSTSIIIIMLSADSIILSQELGDNGEQLYDLHKVLES